MGIRVVPKNLNERQVKRVDKIAASNPERARTVADRISARRDARGAENPGLVKKPKISADIDKVAAMKKGGKVAAKKLVPKKNSVSKNISNLNKAKGGTKMKKKAC